MKRTVTLLLMLTALPLFGQDARALWKDVVQRCSQNDALGGRLLFLGPSNDIGSGTIWRKSGLFHGYGVRWRVRDIDAKPDHSAYIDPGHMATCSGNATSKLALNANVALNSTVYPASAELSADLGRGRTTAVSVKAWSWEQIIEGPYEVQLRSVTDQTVKDDINQANRFVLSRALHVKGLTTEITFDRSAGAGLKAKYDGKKMVVLKSV